MPYITQQHLEDRFGADELLQLTDRDRDDVVDAPVLDAAIAFADGIIDDHLRARYVVPVASPTPTLIDYASDIARYRLHDEEPTDTVAARYKAAIAYLEKVATGKIELAIAKIVTPSQGGEVRIEAPARQFTRDTLAGY